jgi:dolichol-phosphate mannosyltransferase
VDFLKGFNEHDRLFRGLLNWIMPTDKVKVIEFIAPERFSGKSKYNFFKSFSLATDSIIQFSVRPLRLATYIGLFGALISLVMAVYVIIEYYIIQHRTPGYATIMVTLSFLGSVILIALGIIGEYIGKIHMEVKKRPLYMADYLIVPPSKLRKSDGDGVFKRKKEAE